MQGRQTHFAKERRSTWSVASKTLRSSPTRTWASCAFMTSVSARGKAETTMHYARLHCKWIHYYESSTYVTHGSAQHRHLVIFHRDTLRDLEVGYVAETHQAIKRQAICSHCVEKLFAHQLLVCIQSLKVFQTYHVYHTHFSISTCACTDK